MSAWRRAARVAGHALALVAILLCLVLPRSRYDWVSGVDPAVRPSDLVGGGDDAAVVIGACAALAVAVELIALTTGTGRRGKLVPAVLIVAGAAVWLARSLG